MHDILVQREKLAALGTMTASIAHEVNNPNSFIALNIPILKDYIKGIWPVIEEHSGETIEPEILKMPYYKFKGILQETIENIEKGSSRITRIVSTLRNFSRNKHQIKKRYFKINDVIDSVVKICGAKIEFLVYSFEVNIDDSVPERIYFDPDVLEISLINLLNNAVEAIDKKRSWIKLDVFANTVKGENTIIIEVKDNGCGIKNDAIERIFEPFFSTKSSIGGTGLGLYLCHILLQQVGAFIEVESEVGVGSAFRLVFNGS
jgi:signal transduction histidine kinase